MLKLKLKLALALALASPALAVHAQTATEAAPDAQDAAPRSASPEQRMQDAEERYREALVLIRNGSPQGVEESNQALEDMEDVMLDCARAQTDCAFWQLLAAYKRLLKLQADETEAALAGVEPPPVSADAGQDADPGTDPDTENATPETDASPADTALPFPPGTATTQESAASAAALFSANEQRFVQMVQMNPAVQAGIRRWLTDMRTTLITSHENYQYMQHLMSPGFRQHGLPEALLFGIMAKESNGRVHSRSRAGAAGPLQFMPGTGRRFGLGVDASGFDTRYDPQRSADAAARYLLERLQEVGPNIEYWLAAYNGGEGRARRVHAQSGGRSFWETQIYQQFPPETRDYVPMVIAAAWLYLHPDDYGLTFPEIDSRPAPITLARAASIYELTICLGNGDTRDGFLRALRNLNPGYRAETWIPEGTELNATVQIAGLYREHCAQGARAQLARQLIEADPQTAQATVGRAASNAILPAPEPRLYRVREGETLGAIARRHRCNLRTLAAANNVRAPRYLLRIGQRLRLEGCTQ